jgi:hypothetical protein
MSIRTKYASIVAAGAVALGLAAASQAKAATTAAQVGSAEASGQAATNHWEAAQQPGSAGAAYIAANYPSDPMLRIAMATNATQYNESSPPTAAQTFLSPLQPAAASGPAAAATVNCNNSVYNTHYWKDFPTQINLGWIATRVGVADQRGWCFNGSFITSVNGWYFNKWTAIFYCLSNETTTHNGYGATDGLGHTAWAHGRHWSEFGTSAPILGCQSEVSGAATKRISGTGYSDNGY